MVASRSARAFALAMGWLCCAYAAADHGPGSAPTVTIERQEDRITARIARASLRLVLAELRRQAHIHGQLLDATDNDTVSQTFSGLPLVEAIGRLLNGRSFLIDHGASSAAESTTPALQLLIFPHKYSVPPVATMSREQDSMTINELTQAMVDPDENVRARAQQQFEQALDPKVPAVVQPQPPR